MARAGGLRYWVWAALFAALTAVGAQIRIPMVPVPITFQTFFVYLAGGFLGARWGAVSQFFYLILGLAGLPVFAGESGPALLLSPTIGYLLSFPLAAWLTGVLIASKSDWQIPRLIFVYAVAALLILALGVAGLFLIQNLYLGAAFSVRTLLISGMLVFLPGEFVKIVLAAFVTRKLQPLLDL